MVEEAVTAIQSKLRYTSGKNLIGSTYFAH